jgi:hypothetical protein
MYSIQYGNEVTSLSVSDVNPDVIIRNLLCSISTYLQYPYVQLS